MWIPLVLSVAANFLPTPDASRAATVVVVTGAAGSDEYQEQFSRWADRWQSAADKGGATFFRVGDAAEGSPTDHQSLHKILSDQAAETESPLWLILIGHGTYDGREAKFNLRGPDLTDSQLAQSLAPLKRPVCLLLCFSASGPFLNRLSAPGRVILSATRSGDEQNFSRLGDYLSAAISDPSADLDKDRQVSLLEAYLTASSRVGESYRSQSRLATEHPLIDDNGDRLGTPADWFRGLRATRHANDGTPVDGPTAHQFHLIPGPPERALSDKARQTRLQLEQEIERLRAQKETIEEHEYYARLEILLLQLARLYESVDPTPPTTLSPDTPH